MMIITHTTLNILILYNIVNEQDNLLYTFILKQMTFIFSNFLIIS